MSTPRSAARVVSIVTAALVTAVCGQALASEGAQDSVVGGVISRVSPTSIYLRTGVVDASRPRAGLQTLAGQHGRFVIQLDGPMTPARRAALRTAGVQLGDYLPINSYIATFDHADAGRVAGLTFVRWYTPFQNSWKVAPDVGARPLQSNDRLFLQGIGMSALFVDVFTDADVAATINAIMALSDKTEVVSIGSVGEQAQLHVLAPTALVGQLAQIDGVQFIEDAPEITMRNASTTWIIQSNINGQEPLWDHGLHGENQVLGHIDGKININHCSFSDPEGDPPGPNHRKILAYNTSLGSDFHGTHTACTGAGDNGLNDNTRGMAYLAKIVFDDIPSFNETAFYNMLVQNEGQGARVHTNSWGNDGTVNYDGMCRAIDRFSYDYEDNLVAFAVTNQSLLKNPENAKNVLAVGASQDTPNQQNHCSGGAGPTNDGRRKPEIYAPGCNTSSAYNVTSCSVTTATGTSMACPAISGIGLLVRQYYTDGYYPSGAANAADAFIPSGALIKATLINGAVDMTGVAGYPSNKEGWGRLLADYALYFPGDVRTMWTTDVRNASGLNTAQTVEYPIEVTGSGEQLRVTMQFTDPAASSGASFAAINDLDLEVVAPDGTTYKGNVFSNGSSVSGGTKDDRNNLEQVHVNSPAAGSWIVRVNAAAVNVGTQGYALVVSGEVAEPNLCIADFNGDGSVNTQDVLAFLNAWAAGQSSADINGDGNVNTQDVLAFLNLWNAGC
ncbi:MAG: S8 family serine peptidase [Phycisphaerales bacterium]|nr:S8 family serine peptidase [Phycisphaerales bacterium]